MKRSRCAWLGVNLIVLSSLLGQQVTASDWPQYRGPNQDGRSIESGVFPEGGRLGQIAEVADEDQRPDVNRQNNGVSVAVGGKLTIEIVP